MKGFTLIEVIIAVLLMAVILLGGTALFYQNLKATGLSDVESYMSNTLQSIFRSLEKDVRFGEIRNVGDGDRAACLAAGSSGYTGTSLLLGDLGGQETLYSLFEGKVASTSSTTSRRTFLNTDQVIVQSLTFTWYCQNNISDKISITIDVSSSALGSGITAEQNASLEINLLNSGLN